MRCRQQGESVTAGKIRNRGEVLGYGVPTVLFLPRIAYLGITTEV
jgi:hypothetical protein